MARLFKHGKEILRVSKTEPTAADPVRPGSPTGERTVFRAFMSDRVCLARYNVRAADGWKHSSTWKLRGKIKEGVPFAALYAHYLAQGWHVEVWNDPGTADLPLAHVGARLAEALSMTDVPSTAVHHS